MADSEMLKDLERLGRLRDEGTITPEEFDRMKSDLIAAEVTTGPMTGKPSGWYEDPSGVSQFHLAYWDGSRWTGQTKPTEKVISSRSLDANIKAWLIGVVVAVVALSIAFSLDLFS